MQQKRKEKKLNHLEVILKYRANSSSNHDNVLQIEANLADIQTDTYKTDPRKYPPSTHDATCRHPGGGHRKKNARNRLQF